MTSHYTLPQPFLDWWGAVPKQAMHPVFRRMADYPAAGDLLAMLLYWYCPPNGKEEGTRAQLYLEAGERVPWVVLRQDLWREETGTSEKRYRRARRVLEDLDLIEQTNRHYDNRPAIWLRLKVESFLRLWQKAVAEALASGHPRNRYFYLTDRSVEALAQWLTPPAHPNPGLEPKETEQSAEAVDEADDTTETCVHEPHAPYAEKLPPLVGVIGQGGPTVMGQSVRLQSDGVSHCNRNIASDYIIDPYLRSCSSDPELKPEPTHPPGWLVCPKDQERSKTMLAEIGPWKHPGLMEKLAATYPFARVRLVCVRALDQGTDPAGWAYAALTKEYDLGALLPSELLSDFCQRHLTDDEATLVASLRALQPPDPFTPPIPLSPPAPRRTPPTLPIDSREEAVETRDAEDEAQPLAKGEADADAQAQAESDETNVESDEATDKTDEAHILARHLWEQALADLALQVPTGTFDTWLRDSEGLTYADGELQVGTPNPYARDWLACRMTTLAQRVMSRLMQRSVRVTFCTRRHPAAPTREGAPPRPAPEEENP